MTSLKFTGERLSKGGVQVPAFDGESHHPAEKIHPYLPHPDSIKAVNMAILLERPLLLMGEPGGGKTRLAHSLAFELFHREDKEGKITQHYRDWFFEWHIKSNAKAKDGLYEIDTIRRLRDAQIAKVGQDLSIDNYISIGAMGQAFEKSTAVDKRPVLLIDEIDKADIDFPNDLLNELDRGFFTIKETGRQVSSIVKPIVIITSNQERELPDAFLRRCVYHYIDRLGRPELKNIIISRFFKKEEPDNKLIDKALDLFVRIREDIKNNRTAGKNVSTSELLDWFEALKNYYTLIDEGHADESHIKHFVNELEEFRDGKGGIPLKQALFKNWETIVDFEKRKNEYRNQGSGGTTTA